MKISKALCALCMVASSAGATDTDSYNVRQGYFTAANYRAMTQSARIKYVEGIVDGIYFSTFMGASDDRVGAFAECLDKLHVTGEMAALIVDQYVAAHPIDWPTQVNVQVYNAIGSACLSRGYRMK